MKEEVLVSFLGYKEPNLMPVLRCKGLCNNQALSPVACVPTKLRYKKVKMQIKTQYLGHDAQVRSSSNLITYLLNSIITHIIRLTF